MEQDWTPVTIRNPNKTKKTQIQAQANTKHTTDSAQARKFMEHDVVVAKKLSNESRQEIVSRRVLNKWTQVQLNQMCLFPPNTINKIESGQLPPTIGQVQALNRVLKTGLKYEVLYT